jgi:hypothetical protein
MTAQITSAEITTAQITAVRHVWQQKTCAAVKS